MNGVWVVDATPEICNITGITTFTCPDTSNLPGAIVTDPALCDLVTEDLKGCNTCVLFGVGGTDGTNAFNLISGINDFVNTDTDPDSLGPEALCELTGDELIDAYNDIVDATVSGGNADQAKELFADCIATVEAQELTVGNDMTASNNAPTQTSNNAPTQTSNNAPTQTSNNAPTQTSNNAPTQTSNKQSNQEQKVSNQNVEVNKQIEQPKKSSILPLFTFKPQ